MDAPREMNGAAAKLSLHNDRPTCPWCGSGKLDLIEESSDPTLALESRKDPTLLSAVRKSN